MKKVETIDEYLARGGRITVCPPQSSPEPVPEWDDIKIRPEWAQGDDEVPQNVVRVKRLDWRAVERVEEE